MRATLRLLFIACSLTPLPGTPSGGLFPRVVAVLWDSAASQTPHQTIAAQMAEPVLFRLGLLARYHDIRQPLPHLSEDAETLGVLTWWEQNRLPDPVVYVSWLEKQARAGKRVVCIGEPGIDYDAGGRRTAAPVRARFWRILGLVDTGQWEGVTYDQQIVSATREMIGYERPLGTVLPPFRVTVPAVAGLRSHLIVGPASKGRSSTTAAHLVVTGTTGGYAALGYTHSEPAVGRRQWHLDAAAFLEQALGVGEIPKPDPAVVSGRTVALIVADYSGSETLGKGRRPASFAEGVKDLAATFEDLPFSIYRSGARHQWASIHRLEPERVKDQKNIDAVDWDWARPSRMEHEPIRVISFDGDVLNRSALAKKLVDSLRALQSESVLPSSATDYTADLERAKRATIVRAGPNCWEVSAGLSGVRFDHSEHLTVDTIRSSGVVGMMRRKGSLYVALDGAEKRCRIALQKGTHVRASYPLLVESRWRVTRLRRNGDGLVCHMRGFGPGEMVWQVPGAGDWMVEVPAKGLSYQVRVGANLLLAAIVPLRGVDGVEVVVRRRP